VISAITRRAISSTTLDAVAGHQRGEACERDERAISAQRVMRSPTVAMPETS